MFVFTNVTKPHLYQTFKGHLTQYQSPKYYICFKYCWVPEAFVGRMCCVLCCRKPSEFCDSGGLPVQRCCSLTSGFFSFLLFLSPPHPPQPLTLWFLLGVDGEGGLRFKTFPSPSLSSFFQREALYDNNYETHSNICKFNMHENPLANITTFCPKLGQ